MKKYYLGIDIGGTEIKTVLLDEKGGIIDKSKVRTEDSSEKPAIWKGKIVDVVNQYSEKYGDQLRCSISAPGLADAENRCILCMPERLKGIEQLDWSVQLNMDIHVLNDGHAATLAEYALLREEGIQNMLLITLGTGVGGGMILQGQLFQGTDQRAGHFGHITVNHAGVKTMTNMVGSLEYAIGDFSVGERTHNRYQSTHELVKAYKTGKVLATHWWLCSVQALATALASLNNAYAPELIVIGGGISEAGKSLFDPLQEFMDLYEWRPAGKKVEIIKAKHASYAGAMGAAYFAKTKEKYELY